MPDGPLSFARACTQLETILTGATRREILASIASSDFGPSLLRLRTAMRSNTWNGIGLDAIVSRFDAQTRRDGFHALHDWDGVADRVNDNTIPVDVLDFLIDRRGGEPCDLRALAILLDYYFLYLLALLALKIWDDGDADQNLDRVARLLACLQGPDGSGQRFAGDAETLLLIATSHYELYDGAYDRLLDNVRTLNDAHRRGIAMGHAASIGSHLRFGFEATYGRDTVRMRDDNVADYPWLSFSLATLMREYERLQGGDDAGDGGQRDVVVEAILNALSPDARAFLGDRPPPSLARCTSDLTELRQLFEAHRAGLLEAFERCRPAGHVYSPLSFFFNFSHNVLKGMVIDALLRGRPWDLTLNDLFTGAGCDESRGALKEALAKVLMGHARANPHRIRGRLMPVIVYDPSAGRQAFSIALRKIKGV